MAGLASVSFDNRQGFHVGILMIDKDEMLQSELA